MSATTHATSSRPPGCPAVVLLSGGLDSATTLAVARKEGFRMHCLSFDYGQRHAVELNAARRVSESLGAYEHRMIGIDLRTFGKSALTDDIEVPKDRGPLFGSASRSSTGHSSGRDHGSIPITYVPARNTIFLSYALAYAEVIESQDIFLGVNAVDYSGYPDCRPQFIAAFERMANLATRMTVEAGRYIHIHTPLIDMTKAEIIRTGMDLGVDFSLTSSCYDPDELGKPCGRCDSCTLRARGFKEVGIADPLATT